MKGTLAPGILPRILRDLYTGRRTGLLHVSHGDERRSIRFRKGHIVRAETNVASERLGETLVRQGDLSEEDLDRATEVVVRDKKKLGVALQELGIMTRERLDDALAVHVREMLLHLFGWTEGEYEFEELQSEAPIEGDISPRLPTGEMILEAVAAIGDPEIVRRELGDLERFLTPSLDPMLRFQKITLTPSDGFLLSRIDGTLTAREVLEVAAMDREEAERSLFGLICAGVVEWGDRAERRVLPELDAGRAAPRELPPLAHARGEPESVRSGDGAGTPEEAGAGDAETRAGAAEAANDAARTRATEARAAEAARAAAEARATATARTTEAEARAAQAEADAARARSAAAEALAAQEAAAEAAASGTATARARVADAEAAAAVAAEAAEAEARAKESAEAEARAAEAAADRAAEARAAATKAAEARVAAEAEAEARSDEARAAETQAAAAAEAAEAARLAAEAAEARSAEAAALAAESAAAAEAAAAAAADARVTEAEAVEAAQAAAPADEDTGATAPGAAAPEASAAEPAAAEAAATEDPEEVRRQLGDLERRLSAAADPTTLSGRITPAEGFLLSRVDGTLSARGVLDLAPMARDEAERSLLGLIRAGVLAWAGGGEGSPDEARSAATTSELPPLPPLPPLPSSPPLSPEPEPEPRSEPESPRDDPETVRRELGDLERRLAPDARPETHFGRMTPAEGFLLSRVDGTLSAREVLDLAPMEREEAEYGLLRLLRNGVVRWSEKSPGQAEPAAAAPPAPPPEEPEPAPPATPEPARPAPPPAPPAPDPAVEEERAKRRQEIEDLHSRLKTMNHFEALGIPRSSSEKEIKAAYFALARRFHPDTHTDPGIADLEEKIEAIFIRVGEAYEVLRHRTRRADYEASLPRERPRTATVAPAATTPQDAGLGPGPAPPVEEEEDPMQVAARVSGAFKVAAKLYSDERYFDAIKLLEGHLEISQGPIRHRMRLLLAACNAKNPAWAKQAEEIILAVLKEDPKNVQAYLQLAQLYKDKNLKSRAASMFRKVLELDPENERARAEVAPRPAQAAPQSGGLLKKFFGRS